MSNVTGQGCTYYQTHGKIPLADPDIAGIGVIVAFLASAYFTLLWTIFAYFAGLLPAEILNTTDRVLFRTNSRRVNSRWHETLNKAVLIFSDQQIVTGIAILVAGFAGLRRSSGISVYHYQIVIYLAWMSSNVHLTTLTVLRSYLQERKALRTWRITGMLMLFGLLLAALVPTTQYLWSWAVSDYLWFPDATPPDFGTLGGLGMPTRCMWPGKANGIWAHHEGGQYTNPDAVMSYVIIIVSYAWKAGSLFESSRRQLYVWLRAKPENALERSAARRLQFKSRSGMRLRYRLLVAVYIQAVALSDFVESFAASLWLLILGLAWGTFQVFVPRQLLKTTDPDVLKGENSWGFGQLMPLFLLALPLAAIIEHFSSHHDNAEDSQDNDAKSYEPETASLPDELELYTLSEALVRMSTDPAFGRPTSPLQASPLRRILYKSRFFISILVWIQLTIVGGASMVFLLTGLDGGSDDANTYYALLFVAGYFAWMILYMGTGMWFSRLFR